MVDRLTMKSFPLTIDDNPVRWTDEHFSNMLDGQVAVGCLVKNTSRQDDLKPVLNIYIISPNKVEDTSKIITRETLGSIFLQWLETIITDSKSFMFRNPPLDLWLDTKDNWIKKITNRVAELYGIDYDECLSTIYTTLLNCYSRGDVYMGNLNYLNTAIHNTVRLEYRFMKNRLHGNHPNAIHLDANMNDFSGSDEGITTLHELIGGQEDDYHHNSKYDFMLEEIMDDLRQVFSEREIDQIINYPKLLPMPTYRRLLKWRKEHTREDYE